MSGAVTRVFPLYYRKKVSVHQYATSRAIQSLWWRVWVLQVDTQAVGASYLWLVSKIRLFPLAPELIHTGKDTGIPLFELMPQ